MKYRRLLASLIFSTLLLVPALSIADSNPEQWTYYSGTATGDVTLDEVTANFQSAIFLWDITELSATDSVRLCVELYMEAADNWRNYNCTTFITDATAPDTIGFTLANPAMSIADGNVTWSHHNTLLPRRWRLKLDFNAGSGDFISSIDAIPVGR